MKLQAESYDGKHELEIKRAGREVSATVDGREYQLEVSQPEANTYLLKHEGHVYEAFVSLPTDKKAGIGVVIKNTDFSVRILDPKRLRGSGSGSEAADGIAEIRSAMPGKIVRILTEVGEEVVKDQGLIVVEAMKMQNELRSPKTGTVKEVRVRVGATVSAGDVLITIE